jgi:hypothetical protein
MKTAEDGTVTYDNDEERLAAEAEAQRVEAERLAAEQGEETEDEKAARLEAERIAAEESEVVVTIGEESPPSEEDDTKAPEWVRELRKQNRETQRRNRELEEQLKAVSGASIKATELGAKPKLEDFDYDAEKFGTELEAWHERKRVADDAARKKQQDEDAAKAAWQAKLDGHNAAKAKLKVKDYEDAEALVQSAFNVTQQGIILQGSENSALLVYALGKNPKKVKELASINDPIKFAFAVAKLETQVKATPRKAPPPEGRLSGSAPLSGTVDSQLEKLRADAEKTGDYTKVTAYKASKRKAA